MDDATYYVTYLSDLSCEELKLFLDQHPEFMEHLESNELIDALKAETYQNILRIISDSVES